jgi:undecaprenyl-phosphate 4-deoxy-4-formamido-L-arabinose transferase
MNADAAIDVSIVIPVYRSAATLRALAERLMTVLSGAGLGYEIIFVDDGSPDASWGELSRLHAEHPAIITAVQLMRNFGQHNALMCGFRYARGRLVVTLDDDLQNPPEEIPKLLAAIETQGLDVVYGQYGDRCQRRWRNLGSAMVNAFYRTVFGAKVVVSSFRVMRREIVLAILEYRLNFTFVDGLLAWHTQRLGMVPVDHHPRRAGRSGYSLGKLCTLSLNMLTNFSLLPLQAVSVAGFCAASLGFLLGAYYLGVFLLHGMTVPGYASTIIAILVLGGCQLLALGIMGEYLGRLHLNVNRKPQYCERQCLGRSGDDEPVRS